MARPALATLDDLERLLGPIGDAENEDDPERIRAEFLLEHASEIVRAFARTDWLNDAGTDVEDVPGAIPGVVCSIVERATRNPSGAVQETAGPYSRSFGPEAAQRMFLTAAERSIIRHALGLGGIGTLSTTRGDLETAAVVCPADLFPEEEMETMPWES